MGAKSFLPNLHAGRVTELKAHLLLLLLLLLLFCCDFLVLDYVTRLLMGAKGFLPNLHAGTAAACCCRCCLLCLALGAQLCHRLTDGSQRLPAYMLAGTLTKAHLLLLSAVCCALLQVLDYVTGILMGAKGFLPNQHAGTAAACLTRLLSKPHPLSEFEWSQAQQIAHTLRSRHRNAAKAVSDELTAGRANPADTISKLVLAALRIVAPTTAAAAAASSGVQNLQQQQVIKLVLQEWLATMMQRHYGKCTP
jgi:hypothetical protein